MASKVVEANAGIHSLSMAVAVRNGSFRSLFIVPDNLISLSACSL